MDTLFTEAMPNARPAGYFLDGLLGLMIASERLEASWRSAWPTSPTPEPSSIGRFESLWEQHAKSWDSDPLYPHESDGYHVDPRNTSFYLLIQSQGDATGQLKLLRQLGSAVRDWQDAVLHMEGRAPCILPWLETSRGTDTLYYRLLSTMKRMVESVAKPSPSGLPVSGDLDAFAVQTAKVKALMDEMRTVPIFAERQNEIAIRPPSSLPPRSQETLLLLWRAGARGIERKDLGQMYSRRSSSSKANETYADQQIRTLRQLYGYPVSEPPWRLEADKLPPSHRQELDDLVSRDSLETGTEHD